MSQTRCTILACSCCSPEQIIEYLDYMEQERLWVVHVNGNWDYSYALAYFFIEPCIARLYRVWQKTLSFLKTSLATPSLPMKEHILPGSKWSEFLLYISRTKYGHAVVIFHCCNYCEVRKYRIAGKFRGQKFSRLTSLKTFLELNFEDRLDYHCICML